MEEASGRVSQIQDPAADQKIETLEAFIEKCKEDIALLKTLGESSPRTYIIADHTEEGSAIQIMANSSSMGQASILEALASEIPPKLVLITLMGAMDDAMGKCG